MTTARVSEAIRAVSPTGVATICEAHRGDPDQVSTSSMHPIEALFASMPEVEPYPTGVVRVPTRIPGIAFFPGGAGLWGVELGSAMPPMPIGGVMVLGHDFDSEEAFARSLANGTEVSTISGADNRCGPTWRSLLALLSQVGLSREQCFFTNAFMGLRKGASSTGRFPGARDPGFVERCRGFLIRQLSAQRPALVLTLGAWVPAFAAPLSQQLAHWREIRSLAQLDAAGPVVHGVRFVGANVPTCSVVALTHPSLRGPNVGRRRFGALAGHAAEVAMISESIAASRFKTRLDS
jgi:hypothetical protein